MTAVILAGRLRMSPLREALGVHELCLPVGRRGSLLDAWLRALSEIEGLTEIQVVVNNAADVELVTATLGLDNEIMSQRTLVRIVAEPAAWRGAAGILRDVIDSVPEDGLVLVCEGKRLPPATFAPLLEAFWSAEEHAGVVGVCGVDEPAGVYLFDRQILSLIPRIGYVDMKEQFLPAACRGNHKIVTARLSDAVWRLRDLESYLETTRQSLLSQEDGLPAVRISERASVSGSAVLDGFCIVEPGAVIEDGAVVHDSVVLWGATIGGGAVVSRCVIGPLASVEPRNRLTRSLIGRGSVTLTSARSERPKRPVSRRAS